MKKKKNVKHSPKDGPIATHHQAFEEPTDQPPLLPRPFSSILPEHCGTPKREKSGVSFRPRTLIRGRGSRRKLAALNKIAAVFRYPLLFWRSRGADDRLLRRTSERILEIARARTSDDERGSSPFGREQAATPPYIFPLKPRAGFNGRNTGGEEERARGARRREASRRLHRRAQCVNVRAWRMKPREGFDRARIEDRFFLRSRFLGDILISYWKDSSGYFGITLVFLCVCVSYCLFFLQYLCCYEMEIINNCSFWKFIH